MRTTPVSDLCLAIAGSLMGMAILFAIAVPVANGSPWIPACFAASSAVTMFLGIHLKGF